MSRPEDDGRGISSIREENDREDEHVDTVSDGGEEDDLMETWDMAGVSLLDSSFPSLGFQHEEMAQQLLLSAEAGDVHTVSALLSHEEIDPGRSKGLGGFTPLHHASARGHLAVVELLLKHGWKPNDRNDAGEAPLHLAAYHNRISVAECLLDRGADIDASNDDDETPLFYAVRKRHIRMIALLVRRECDVDRRNCFGDTAEDEALDDELRSELSVRHKDSPRLSKPVGNDADLSQSLREHILSFADVKSLTRMSQVAYRWSRAADRPSLWQVLGVSRWRLQLESKISIAPLRTKTPLASISESAPMVLHSARSKRKILFSKQHLPDAHDKARRHREPVNNQMPTSLS